MDNDLAVYIHWPYCARICPYCDFNVYKQREDKSLRDAIISDLYYWKDWTGKRKLTSIHFGGGTPSLLSAEDIKYIRTEMHHICWGIPQDCEVAIEANPSDADEVKWRDYAKFKVSRLSLGVQSFHEPALKLLGRDHNADQARAACALARDIFPSISFDLIYGWAGQTKDLLQRDLDIALSHNPDHLSAYQLTVEEGTAFAKAEARGDTKAVDSDRSADFYQMVRERLIAEGFEHYEVSNFAKPGHRSQHNLAYWRGQDYVGVGPGAHGRLTVDGDRYATIAHMRPDSYQHAIKTQGHGIEHKELLSRASWAEEYVLMGLRIEDGISVTRYQDISGQVFSGDVLKSLIDEGLIIKTQDRIKATDKGRLLLNWVTEKLLLS